MLGKSLSRLQNVRHLCGKSLCRLQNVCCLRTGSPASDLLFGGQKLPVAKPGRYRLNPQNAVTAMNLEKDPEKVVSVFLEASEHHRFHHFRKAYEVAVKKLSRSGRCDAVQKILEHEKALAYDPRNPRNSQFEGFMMRIISLYGRAGMPEMVIKTFQELRESPVIPSAKLFNAVLSALLEARQCEQVRDLFFEVLRNDGINPNLVTFNVLFKALCAMERSDEAFSLIDTMEKHDCSPDTETFNVILKGFYNEGKLEDAARVLEKLRQNGLRPDLNTYNIRISQLCTSSKSVEAKKLLNTMRSEGTMPNALSYSYLINGFCKEHNLSEAENIMEDMALRGCEPTKQSYFTFLYYHCVEEGFERALEICFTCFRRNWLPNSNILQMLVEGLTKAGKLEEAGKVIEEAKRRLPANSLQQWDKISVHRKERWGNERMGKGLNGDDHCGELITKSIFQDVVCES